MEIVKKLFSYLRLFLGEIKFCDIENPVSSEDLCALYRISKYHNIVPILAEILKENGVLEGKKEIDLLFAAERNKAVFHYEQMQYEFGYICELFIREEISFIPLKGAIIRNFYPEPWMRTSCDIDILIRKEDLKKALTVLKEKRNYRCEAVGEYDAQLYSENGEHLELHYSLTEMLATDAEKKVFDNVWENVQGDTFYKQMPDPMFYCYHISHIAKHIRYGGCGVRAILDTWILNHRVSFDRKEREVLLKKAQLFYLAQGIENLSEVWFSKKSPDARDEELAKYILSGGTYGTFKNKVSAQKALKKNKISYLFSRFFISYSQLKFKYPRLQKFPVLYPFYIVKRWALLLKKEKRKLARYELGQTLNGDKNTQKRIKKLFKSLGL